MTAQKTSPRPPLSREIIVKTALQIVDKEGLDALSMRRLGAELGANPMAAYYHVPNKPALLDGIVEAVMTEMDLSVDDPSAPARERIVRAAMAYADVLTRHSKALPLLLVRGPATPAALMPVELMVSILRDGGLAPADAVAGMTIVTAAVRGYAGILANEAGGTRQHKVEEQVAFASPEQFPCLSEAAALPPQDARAQLEHGLHAIAVGLLAGDDAGTR